MTGTGPRRVVIPAPDRNARGHLCPVDGYLLSLLLNIVGERHLEWLTVKGLEPEIAAAIDAARPDRRRPQCRRPDWLTVPQVAEIIGKDASTVRRWLYSGRLAGEQSGPQGSWAGAATSVDRLTRAATNR